MTAPTPAPTLETTPAPAPQRPSPAIRTRRVDPALFEAATTAGHDPIAARVIAGRMNGLAPDELLAILDARLTDLDHYDGLPDIERAANRLADTVLAGEVIAIETDHDVDGVTSHAVLRDALIQGFGHPCDRVAGFIGHRLRDGYGLSDPVAERILAAEPRPSLVITADNGSSDEPRIARLAAAGIDVIVTDHHELPLGGPPPSAYACVTPQRDDSRYPDRAIAGCMVAWLLVCATRAALVAHGHEHAAQMRLASLLDFVALGTVADCVSLATSRNNRAVVRAGLDRINAGARPCWRAAGAGPGEPPLTATDLAFGIGPRINARGRLDEAMAGVGFLLAADAGEAQDAFALLERENEARKAIERDLKADAMTAAAEQAAAGATALVVWLPNGHPGVHGIIASRVTEAFGRPTVCLSPKAGDAVLASGSARGVDGFHVRAALQACADAHPELFVAFGGHVGAGGLTLAVGAIPTLRSAFDVAARTQLHGRVLEPVVWTDGALPVDAFALATVDRLHALGPYGKGFESPVFEGRFRVAGCDPVGDGTHLRLTVQPAEVSGGRPPRLAAIWFRALEDAADEPPIATGDVATLAYELTDNHWHDQRRLQLIVRTARVTGRATDTHAPPAGDGDALARLFG